MNGEDLPLSYERIEGRNQSIAAVKGIDALTAYVLHKMWDNEQKVHDRTLHYQQYCSALSIPNYLPPKMTELLSELAMVENEITQLESQINRLKAEARHENEVHMESKSKKWERKTLKNHHESYNISTRFNERAVFEIKALHFISKAMNGDHKLSDLSIDDKAKNSRMFSCPKENTYHDRGETFQEKILKSNGTMKSPSPLREPRHPTPWSDHGFQIAKDIPTKILYNPLHHEEDHIHKWPPNKLSENIIKCLIFIFVRLLRTSRAMELEKSGPISRSTNFSHSFRADTSSNSKSGLKFVKDSRQQDPYGIFDSEESITRDIGAYKNLVRFTSTSMELKCIKNSRSVSLFKKLKILMEGLEKVDLRFLSHQQKLAFWINMYNACIMHGYLQYGVPSVSSPEKLLTLINKATLNISGNRINAQEIERVILRKPAGSLDQQISWKTEKIDAKEMIVHELYGLETPDPNIPFALCCGTRSSPAVKIYTAEGVTAELERSKLEYLQAAIVVTSTKKIAIPELVLKNMQNFAQDLESLLEWMCHQLPASGSLRKSIVDCLRGVDGGKVAQKIPYNSEFQYLLAIST
ncbi:hypothetical protein DH2020_021198 [Rehmannia glutinosa]|uniref:DUF547 domain-containing protein n=1 Tax=Rehmannia glutinosa TaxID=99300 RepID=A0ABR0WC00_REHGL